MKYDDKVIVMENGEKYIVIYELEYDGNIYLYLVNRENDTDTMFVEIKDNKISGIDAKLFTEKVFPLFVEKLKKD